MTIKLASSTEVHWAESSWGRMGLHLLCFLRDHHVKSHFRGIFREVRLICLL